jgi:hypothetical protein
MGTSASSKGPGGGVPMVPPWVPDAAPPAQQPAPGTPPPAAPNAPNEQPAPVSPNPPQQPAGLGRLAPAGRFGSARQSLGKFASGGNARDMRRGIRDYVRKGYGGRATAVRRFGGTASTADVLHGVLSGTPGAGAPSGTPIDRSALGGRTAKEIIDAVIEAVRPADGTQDAEGSRAAIKDAMSELLTVFPDADPLQLNDEQRDFTIERFVAGDVFNRIQLDIGKTVQEKAPTATVAQSRLKDIKNYVKETVAAAFRKLRAAGTRLSRGGMNSVVTSALRDAFEVFEAWT